MKKQFKIGENNISYLGSNFQEWFGDMQFESGEKIAHAMKLPRSMNDKEIEDELKPTEVTLGELYTTLQSLDKSIWWICYIRDVNGVLRAVYGRWFGGGWNVLACSVVDPGRWDGGFQILSRNSFGTQKIDPLTSPRPLETLEQAIELVKKNGYQVAKIL